MGMIPGRGPEEIESHLTKTNATPNSICWTRGSMGDFPPSKAKGLSFESEGGLPQYEWWRGDGEDS